MHGRSRLPVAGRGAARRFEVDAGDRRNASSAVKSSIIGAILVPGCGFQSKPITHFQREADHFRAEQWNGSRGLSPAAEPRGTTE